MTTSHKVVRIHAYGNREVLAYEDAPLPTIDADEVLVKIHATSINPVDWKVREGYLQGFLAHKLPLTLGWDFAGEITVAPILAAMAPMPNISPCAPARLHVSQKLSIGNKRLLCL
jgi:hypothetical protein